jgi:hypothetical protein
LLRLETVGLLLILAAAAQAAPAPEILREEHYNYRVVGALPRGWKRAPAQLVFTYAVDDIPLAFVHLVRERVSGNVDVKAELARRAEHYRFPGAPKSAKGKITSTSWADREAYRYEHEAELSGVICRRVVRAMVDSGIWYECIETHHGEASPAVQAGLACFRTGFLLLTQPVPKKWVENPAAKKHADGIYGFRIEKPEGYVFAPSNPGADPGCRLTLLRRGPKTGQQLSIRVFEYGVRKTYDAAHWLDLLDQAFRRSHTRAKREPTKAPKPEGSVQAAGTRLLGRRDEQDVATTIYLWQSRTGRVFGMRIVSHGSAETVHKDSLDRVIESLVFTGRER